MAYDYDYASERPNLFTVVGLKTLIEARDQANKLFETAGAFRHDKLRLTGDSWMHLACMDYMVERGEFVLLNPNDVGEHRIYTRF